MSDNTEFNAFGKPVPLDRRSRALMTIREMGVNGTERAWECIGLMSSSIERDDPYKALEAARRFVDLTGAYRLMAVLCTDTTSAKGEA